MLYATARRQQLLLKKTLVHTQGWIINKGKIAEPGWLRDKDLDILSPSMSITLTYPCCQSSVL